MKKIKLKNKLNFIVSMCLVVFCSCESPDDNKGLNKKAPNVIFILTDDLGYGDLGVTYQNQRKENNLPYHRTPNLDKMAEESMMLTRHYVPAPVCAPSRASLLTGRHQGHEDIRNNQFDKALTDTHNIATVLKTAGYATAIIGKYGLQGEGDSPETWPAYPTKRGFDYFFGYVRHVDGHNHYPAHSAPLRPPMELYDGNTEISKDLKGCYTTDLFTAMAKKYVVDHQSNNPDQPFFLYLSYNTPHAGLQVASSPYPDGGGKNGGVKYIGESGKYINTVVDTVDLFIHPDYQEQDWPEVQKRFASMVRRIDDGVGDLLQLLRDLGIEEETLVVFTSDNGPHHESYGYGDYAPDFFESFGDLDGTKRDTWEGGIRVPTLVKWPGVVTANTRNHSPSGFHDWLPTLADFANLAAPAITDGVSLAPILTGKTQNSEGIVYIEYSVNGTTPEYESFHPSHKGQTRGEMQVLYHEGYKGVRYDVKSANDDFKIYDTHNDPGEEKDLANTTEAFEKLQQKMKDRVLQVRRPNDSALRPYDGVPVPALQIESGDVAMVQYSVFNENAPWVPDVNSIKSDVLRKGSIEEISIKNIEMDDNAVIKFTGLFFISETAEYAFSAASDGGAVLRIHDALVIEADKGYEPLKKVEASIYLEKGYHPYTLIYKKGLGSEPYLQFDWEKM
ncbi:sulfatase-like hydrolase/transferase [Pararhodonellum marinum]|uniref:sulfatase-like hydrolase/transferase n=1 Tax=Pararhodonellum marinum TaxID=2755358 RepID=UPI0018903307|nr:sulfatase-like hydrolase/transferase [Pararhodonellum marinum]